MKYMVIGGCIIAAVAVIIGLIEVFTGKNIGGWRFQAGENVQAEVVREGRLFVTAGLSLAVTCLASIEMFFPKFFNLPALLIMFWSITQLTSWGRSANKRAAQREAQKFNPDRGDQSAQNLSRYNNGKKIKK